MSYIANYLGGNHLLDTIPIEERDRVLQRCEAITVSQAETIGFPGETIQYVYFPIDCVISLIAQHAGDDALSFALVGNDSLAGALPSTGVDCWRVRAKVFSGGRALWIRIADWQAALEQAPKLQQRLGLCEAAMQAQRQQSLICQETHGAEQRLAYWLLMLQDIHRRNRYYASHPMLAELAGETERTVAAAADRLSRSQVIDEDQGHILILDRRGLERAACSCYRAVTDKILQKASEEFAS